MKRIFILFSKSDEIVYYYQSFSSSYSYFFVKMPGPTRRKKSNIGITSENRKYKTKRRTRDIDLIVQDLSDPVAIAKLNKPILDLDLPGGGQFYCVHCAKHYITQQALGEHKRGKVHKKRVKETDEVPYSIEESERAGGLGSYIPPPAKRSRPDLMEIEEPIKVSEISD